MNILRQISIIIYRLKRTHGGRVLVILPGKAVHDRKTGKTVQPTKVIEILRAPILPASQQRKFDYDLSFIAANKNFTYGGFFDTVDNTVIIDNADLRDPQTGTLVKLSNNDKISIDSQLYDIVRLTETQDRKGQVLAIKRTETASYVDLLANTIHITDSASAVIA